MKYLILVILLAQVDLQPIIVEPLPPAIVEQPVQQPVEPIDSGAIYSPWEPTISPDTTTGSDAVYSPWK